LLHGRKSRGALRGRGGPGARPLRGCAALPPPAAGAPRRGRGRPRNRDVLARKLAALATLLRDLEPHAGKSAAQVHEARYEIERILELLVQVTVDLLGHELAEQGVVPASHPDTFLQAGRRGLLPEDLAASLADAAGLRNVLVHLYERIDYEIVAASIDRSLRDFGRVVDLYRERLED
jgi:uncharacterized protein YutE (UPF0331/DUF86 family)